MKLAHNQLVLKIMALTDREYILYPAGIDDALFHLGEKGVEGLHLIDATTDEVLAFINSNK